MQQQDVVIIGAGIGGLTAALSLHAFGIPVRIYESAPELLPLGVGINLLPHAVRELSELGLLPALSRAGIACAELAYFSKRGERIWAEQRGIAAGYHWPQISIHRGTLQLLLLQTTLERIGPERVHLAHHLNSYRSTRDGVRIEFIDRATEQPLGAQDAAMMIAADGIHSSVRKQLYPDEGGPIWNGAVMWRGTAVAPPFLDGRTMIMAGHTQQKFVCYPIETRPDGQQLINFIAELRFDSTALSEREDWSRPGNLDDFLPRFLDWQFNWLDVPNLIRSSPGTLVYPMVDRDPLPAWQHGMSTLLGDAAHPMYPIGSNGASQAILDARVLTGCVRHHGITPAALQRYEALRRDATAKIVLANRGQGPEAAMQLVEDRAPDGFARLHDVVSAEELQRIADHYKQIAGFAITALNGRDTLAAPTA